MPNLEFWGAPRGPGTLFCGKTSLEKIVPCEQEMTIKGMKFQNFGFPLDFRSMFQMTQGGYTPTNFFYFFNSISLLREGSICQILSFGGAQRGPGTLFCGKTSIKKIVPCDQKMTIKGMKFQNSGFPLDFMSMFQMTQGGIHPPIF